MTNFFNHKLNAFVLTIINALAVVPYFVDSSGLPSSSSKNFSFFTLAAMNAFSSL